MSCFLCWPCDSCVSGCSELHVQPVGSLPLLHPKVKTVWADLPWSCCRNWGSIQLIPCREAIHPKASMQILGGSITYCQGKSSSLGLLPLEKSSGTGAKDTSAAGECSTQDRLSIQPWLASSRVFHCHTGILTLFLQKMEPRCPQMAARPLHAFSDTLVPKPDT